MADKELEQEEKLRRTRMALIKKLCC